VTFEGGEGSGKSTQARLLSQRLKRAGYHATHVREPGGTSLGDLIREVLKRSGISQQLSGQFQQALWSNVAPLTELLLFEASRAQLVAEVIRPNLQQRRAVVVCDRFTDSTLAYQGYGRGLDRRTIRALNRLATGRLQPDLTFLLDMDVERGLRRRARAAREDGDEIARDRFDAEELAFHRRVRRGYLALARRDPRRWVVLDARLPIMKLHEQVWQQVAQRLHRL
jgi:dTMP kinase